MHWRVPLNCAPNDVTPFFVFVFVSECAVFEYFCRTHFALLCSKVLDHPKGSEHDVRDIAVAGGEVQEAASKDAADARGQTEAAELASPVTLPTVLLSGLSGIAALVLAYTVAKW